VFIEAKRFEAAWGNASGQQLLEPVCGSWRGGVVNHHFLATDLLATFFAKMSACRPGIDRVIILSPDHYQQARHVGLTQTRGYTAQGATVAIDAEAVSRLVAEVPAIDVRDEPFQTEHGIGALVPFLAKAWPRAALVPVVVKNSMDQSTASRVAAWASDELARDPQTVLIVSSDMSHYLPIAVARARDEETRRAFATGDAAFFWRATDNHTDNGKSLWIAWQALGKGSAWHEFAHGASTDYGGEPGYTTTYVTGAWQ
jgi:AmmeMemoRadiSam system protein B